MRFLYTDETNIDPTSTEFFVYGGICVSEENAPSLSKEIDELRKIFNYRPLDILKFNTRERPSKISPESHREIKMKIMEAAVKNEVKLFSSFILHNIATSPEDARLNEINRLCYHFDCYHNQVKDSGLVLIDPFQDGNLRKHLCEKFSIGISGLPYTRIKRLENILGFHQAQIGTSHFCSLIDIVVGSLRYSVNNRNDPHKKDIALQLISQIAPLCLREGNSGKVNELSVFFSPKIITVSSYLHIYKDLHSFFTEGGMEPAQILSNMRTY